MAVRSPCGVERFALAKRSACYVLVGLLTRELSGALAFSFGRRASAAAKQWRKNVIRSTFTYSGGAVPESHRVPCFAESTTYCTSRPPTHPWAVMIAEEWELSKNKIRTIDQAEILACANLTDVCPSRP